MSDIILPQFGVLEQNRQVVVINKIPRCLHILIIEQRLGRPLYQKENVHHININSLDNTPSNLSAMTAREHGMCHHSLEMCGVYLLREGFIKFDNGDYIVT